MKREMKVKNSTSSATSSRKQSIFSQSRKPLRILLPAFTPLFNKQNSSRIKMTIPFSNFLKTMTSPPMKLDTIVLIK